MQGDVNGSRRAVLAALAWIAVAPVDVLAQDPRAAQVQGAAREWLKIADTLDAEATWKASGARFQQAVAPERWAVLLREERGPRGALVQRAVIATRFASSLPGLPDGGTYALVRFRSVFENQSETGEDLTLEVGSDYAWHVIGYAIL